MSDENLKQAEKDWQNLAKYSEVANENSTSRDLDEEAG